MRFDITPWKITAVDGTAVFTESIAVSCPFVSDVSLATTLRLMITTDSRVTRALVSSGALALSIILLWLFSGWCLIGDINGPFDKAWRDGDSKWAEATPEELMAALDRLRGMSHQERQVWFAKRLALRARVGQTYTITAFKPLHV